MVRPFWMSKTRGISLGLLLVVLSCSAFGRSLPQESAPADKSDWPREILTAGARITVYEPQLDSLKGNRLTSRAAISVLQSGSSAAVYGGVWFEADLELSADLRTATPRQVKVTEIRFPNLGAGEADELRRAVAAEFPRWKLTYSMDRMIAELQRQQEQKAAAQALRSDVPQILFRSHPALLLTIEGEPVWRAIADRPYQRLANSGFFVVREPDSAICFLHVDPYWWISKGPLGPWESIDSPPAEIAHLWKNEPKPDVPTADPSREAPPRPEIVPATRPSELIWTDGLPRYAPITGTDLLFVKNTESDLFLDIRTQQTYALLSGRWYRSEAEKAAWEFVPSDQLPADFGRIPIGSEKQHVLACVAGTPEARDAARAAEIPHTEAVKPGPAPDLKLTYDGAPRFTEVPASPVRYAVNTPYSVLAVDDRYYCCQDGIWYDSDVSVGPWFVCSWVPPSIYLLPPSCPHYYVTFCRIFCATASSICSGYYPGYRGCFLWGPTVVYGTGWHYRCWSGSIWYPRPVTWGVGVRFNLACGGWTFGLGGGGTCAWMGLHRSPAWRAPAVQVGVGGCWNGVGYRLTDVDVHHNAALVATPVPSRPTTLYARQPEKIVPMRPMPVERGSAAKTAVEPPRHPARPEAPPAPTAGRESAPSPDIPRPAPASRGNPRRPDVEPPASDAARRAPPAPAPKETPRTPPPAPPPAPPSRDHRESPKAPPPPPPPPRERQESPKSPPPAPPPPQHREPPHAPPPPPPPPPQHHDDSKDRSPGRR